MAIILHITERSAWEAAEASGRYTAPSLETEGFIHCSTPRQAIGTANHFFRGQRGLVLLCIDESKIGAEVRYEPPTGGVIHDSSVGPLFPHLYGPLDVGAVIAVVDFPPNADGTFTLPPDLARIS